MGFVPTASKLYPAARGLVPRDALVDQVGGRQGEVVVVSAPPGYGKSTFLADLATADQRPAAWVSLTAAENEAATLLTYIALALDQVEPVEAGCIAALWTHPPKLGSSSLQGFAAMLAARRRPFMLLLDDVHELVSRDALDVLPVLMSEVPVDSCIVLASRSAIPLPLGRIRVKRRLVEVGPAELAFDVPEAATLFDALGVDLPAHDRVTLVEHTEGWPVAVYLAALALRTGRSSTATLTEHLVGRHRYVVEYLAEEMFAQLDPSVASFLMDASCLERLSGEVCDDILERSGSGRLLDELQRQTLLVVPLDDHRGWYRFHHLLAQFLQGELALRSPNRSAHVHRRASEWCDDHGDADGAVTHAVRAGDFDRAESLVMRWFATMTTQGPHIPTVAHWVGLFPDAELHRRPHLMALSAWGCFDRGEPGAAQWLERAAAALVAHHPADAAPLGPEVALAAARMVIAPLAPAEMTQEASYVHDMVGLGDGHPAACLILGAAAFMRGDEAEAVARLREGAATRLVRPISVANCLAHLAIVDIENGRWAQAEVAARRARELVDDATSVTTVVLVLAVRVLVESHAGRSDAVEADREMCRQHLTGLVDVAPWLNLQVRILLARDALLRASRVEAATWVDEAAAILDTMDGATRVARQLAALRREVTTTRDRTHSFGPMSLTTAELRVLRLLPTHLSIAEIADRHYVSRNTVKSQTIAIYRKLGASSRHGAIQVAVAAGLLEPAPNVG